MKKVLLILIIGLFSCEEQVEIPLPSPENLLVVEGFITDSLETQEVQISRSLAFSSASTLSPVENADVSVETSSGDLFLFSHQGQGSYQSITPFAGISGTSYRLIIELGAKRIESTWDRMPEKVAEFSLEVSSFLENDPDSDNDITIYYPKITALDQVDVENHYRWILWKNGAVFSSPEPITIQDDRFFDGNLIPNNFQNFDYQLGDLMEVQLISTSKQTYEFLDLLRSQITTLGRSSGTTPAIVQGNLRYIDDEELVLGYFGTSAIRSDSIRIR